MIQICKRCQTYLLDHTKPELFYAGWKRCPGCGWCCDKDGYNLVDKKPEEKKDGKEVQQESPKGNFGENE